MVLRAPTPEEPGLPKVSIFRVHGDTESGGPPGARLVVSREELNGQEECNNTDCHGDRCLNAGLGNSLPGLTDQRTLVSDGTEEPHKLSGTPCSLVRSESICQGQEEHSYPFKDGQQDSSVLRKPNGENPFPNVKQPSHSVMAVEGIRSH